MPHAVEAGHDGGEGTGGADVGGCALAFDVLLAGLQGHTDGAVALCIDGDADDTAGHLAQEALAASVEAGGGAAVAHRDAETLGGADHAVSAPLARRREQRQSQQVGGHAHEDVLAVRFLDPCAEVVDAAPVARVLDHRAEEDKKKKLINKLLKIETNQKEFLYKEKLKYEKNKKKRLKYFKTCRNIKNDLDRNLTEDANEILDYQNFVLSKQKVKDEQIKLKKVNIQGKTILHQMEFEKNLKTFYKQLYRIKSESVIKKNKEQKRKIYRDLKRAEYEAKKREEEERLLNQQVG